MGANASDVAVYGPQTHAYVLKKGEVIDLQVINWYVNCLNCQRLSSDFLLGFVK